MTINAWLTNFLWSQASQVIQSYGTSNAGYGLIFLAAHFVWALSLMFLYSGRGYWQELIESILWSHNKLHLSPHTSKSTKYYSRKSSRSNTLFTRRNINNMVFHTQQ